MSIQHENPVHQDSPVAYATYNFVPLAANDVMVKAANVYSKLPPDTASDVHNTEEDQAEAEKTPELPPHDRYDTSRHTGYFDMTLTTKSPLYVRCALSRNIESSDTAQARFFHKRAQKIPVIPGSSLRGMLRSVIEIASYGKFNRVTDRRLFYRDVRNPHLYTSNFVEALPYTSGTKFNWQTGAACTGRTGNIYAPKTKTGFITTTGKMRMIEGAIVGRIDIPALEALLDADLYQLNKGRKLRPLWEVTTPTAVERLQYRDIWVDLDTSEKDYFFPEQPGNFPGSVRHRDMYLRIRMARNPSLTAVPGKIKGTLVLTGPMQYQHLAFVFFRKADVPAALSASFNISGLGSIAIPDASTSDDPNEQLWERFHEDQLTQWQEGAFPKDRNGRGRPRDDGSLCNDDPVFYLTENGGGAPRLVFFGRASLFRLPYKTRPIDLVPASLTDDRVIDYADALFGYVRDKKTEPNAKAGEPERAYAGRVCITEARLAPKQTDIWLSSTPQTPKTIVPKVLSSPKPTSYQHYLTQRSGSYPTGQGRQLFHYDNNSAGNVQTGLRGHKLYWHQGWQNGKLKTDSEWFDAIDEPDNERREDTQHTKLNPLKPDVSFTFRVYFENLNARELGALCWAINPAPETNKVYCHKLGMGKPLGMGSVKLNATLALTDRTARYTSLFADDKWDVGSKMTITEAEATKAFEEHILKEITPQRSCSHLSEMKRIAILLRMMEFTDNRNFARNMPLEDRDNPGNTTVFKMRPVLPDPFFIWCIVRECAGEARRANIAQCSCASSCHRAVESGYPCN